LKDLKEIQNGIQEAVIFLICALIFVVFVIIVAIIVTIRVVLLAVPLILTLALAYIFSQNKIIIAFATSSVSLIILLMIGILMPYALIGSIILFLITYFVTELHFKKRM